MDGPRRRDKLGQGNRQGERIHVKAVGGERSWEEAEDTQVAAGGLPKKGWGWLAGTSKDALLRAAIIKAPEKSRLSTHRKVTVPRTHSEVPVNLKILFQRI